MSNALIKYAKYTERSRLIESPESAAVIADKSGRSLLCDDVAHLTAKPFVAPSDTDERYIPQGFLASCCNVQQLCSRKRLYTFRIQIILIASVKLPLYLGTNGVREETNPTPEGTFWIIVETGDVSLKQSRLLYRQCGFKRVLGTRRSNDDSLECPGTFSIHQLPPRA